MSPSTIVSLASVAKPVDIKMRVVRGTQVAFTIQLENDDGTNPDTTSDVVEFTLTERKGGVSRLTKTLANVTPVSGILSLTFTSTDLTFTGISALKDEVWSYAIRRQIGGSGTNEIVYIEGDFVLLSTASSEVP